MRSINTKTQRELRINFLGDIYGEEHEVVFVPNKDYYLDDYQEKLMTKFRAKPDVDFDLWDYLTNIDNYKPDDEAFINFLIDEAQDKSQELLSKSIFDPAIADYQLEVLAKWICHPTKSQAQKKLISKILDCFSLNQIFPIFSKFQSTELTNNYKELKGNIIANYEDFEINGIWGLISDEINDINPKFILHFFALGGYEWFKSNYKTVLLHCIENNYHKQLFTIVSFLSRKSENELRLPHEKNNALYILNNFLIMATAYKDCHNNILINLSSIPQIDFYFRSENLGFHEELKEKQIAAYYCLKRNPVYTLILLEKMSKPKGQQIQSLSMVLDEAIKLKQYNLLDRFIELNALWNFLNSNRVFKSNLSKICKLPDDDLYFCSFVLQGLTTICIKYNHIDLLSQLSDMNNDRELILEQLKKVFKIELETQNPNSGSKIPTRMSLNISSNIPVDNKNDQYLLKLVNNSFSTGYDPRFSLTQTQMFKLVRNTVINYFGYEDIALILNLGYTCTYLYKALIKPSAKFETEYTNPNIMLISFFIDKIKFIWKSAKETFDKLKPLEEVVLKFKV